MNIPFPKLLPILRKEVEKCGVASRSACEHVQNQPYVRVREVVTIFQQCNIQNSVSKTQTAIISCFKCNVQRRGGAQMQFTCDWSQKPKHKKFSLCLILCL